MNGMYTSEILANNLFEKKADENANFIVCSLHNIMQSVTRVYCVLLQLPSNKNNDNNAFSLFFSPNIRLYILFSAFKSMLGMPD